MAKSQVNAACPANVEKEIEEYKSQNGLSSRSEAARQLIERGIDDWKHHEPRGLWLVRQSTGVSGIASLMAGVLAVTSLPGLTPAFFGLIAVTIVFASIWGAMMVLDEGVGRM